MTSAARRIAAFAAIVIVFGVLRVPAASADNGLESWLRSDPRAAQYRPIADEATELARVLADSNIPDGFLVRIIAEAAAKRVSPTAVVSVFRRTVDAFLAANAVLSEVGFLPERPDGRDSLFVRLGIVFSAGLDVSVFEELVVYADNLDKLLTVSEAIAETLSVTDLEPDAKTALGRSLLASRLPVSAYGSVPSVYLRGRAGGLSTDDVTTVIIDALGRGGGLVQIDAELRRRVR